MQKIYPAQYINKIKILGNKAILAILTTAVIILFILLVLIVILYASSLQTRCIENACALPVSDMSSQHMYLHSAVASDAVPCASVSNNIMSVKGGNAVDGAIAGLLCTCAINFHSCGIGGGSFMVIYVKSERKAYAVDIREMAPGAASESMYENDDKASLIGGKSIAVMGLVSGYYEVHKKFGKLPWESLFQPTIDVLNSGFFVSKSLEYSIKYFFGKNNSSQYMPLRDLLINEETGKPKQFGDIIKIPSLAKTLKILSAEPYAMKNGSLVDVMVKEIQLAGGIITKEDFGKYETKWRAPISVNLVSGKKLYTLPPPSSGVLVAFSLNVLSKYDFNPSFLNNCENTGLFFHRLVETMKFSYAKRTALGDIDFVNKNELLRNLTSDNYATWIRSLITDDQTHPIEYYHPEFEIKQDYGTSHFSLVSPNGDAVAATSTINYLLGSLVLGNETGILYNDEMDDFSSPRKSNVYNLPPSPNNFIRPYKRPMSSMSPTIVVDNNGNVELVVGASGGSRILSAITQVTVLTQLFNKGIKEAIDAPRVHHQLLPDEVFVEHNFPEPIILYLTERGHKVSTRPRGSITQGIKKLSRNYQWWQCNADYDKMGLCDGS